MATDCCPWVARTSRLPFHDGFPLRDDRSVSLFLLRAVSQRALTQAASTQPRLAAERLAEIAGLEQFRPGFRNRIIGLFRVAVSEHLPHCLGEQACEIDQRLHAAHSLKGAAHGIGAARLAALAYAVEQAATADTAEWTNAEPIREEAALALQLLGDWAAGADISDSLAD